MKITFSARPIVALQQYCGGTQQKTRSFRLRVIDR
jgi:hypothetical protein